MGAKFQWQLFTHSSDSPALPGQFPAMIGPQLTPFLPFFLFSHRPRVNFSLSENHRGSERQEDRFPRQYKKAIKISPHYIDAYTGPKEWHLDPPFGLWRNQFVVEHAGTSPGFDLKRERLRGKTRIFVQREPAHRG